jgi:hypothetical protein
MSFERFFLVNSKEKRQNHKRIPNAVKEAEIVEIRNDYLKNKLHMYHIHCTHV